MPLGTRPVASKISANAAWIEDAAWASACGIAGQKSHVQRMYAVPGGGKIFRAENMASSSGEHSSCPAASYQARLPWSAYPVWNGSRYQEQVNRRWTCNRSCQAATNVRQYSQTVESHCTTPTLSCNLRSFAWWIRRMNADTLRTELRRSHHDPV